MADFLSSMFAEMGARRRRLRLALGDRGQGIAEFLVLAGLGLGSLGLFVREWMPGAAPWGFAVPVVFVAGFLLIETRRQAAVSAYKQRLPEICDALDRKELDALLAGLRSDPDFDQQDLAEAEGDFQSKAESRRQSRLDRVEATVASSGYDWIALLWSFGCALAGAAAFVIAWTAQPPAPPSEDVWTPPEHSVPVDISP